MTHEHQDECAVCEQGMSHDDVELKVLADIERDGWSDMAIFPTDEEVGLPFNYTAGMANHGHPDLIMVGLPNQLTHELMWIAAKKIIAGGAFLPNTYSDEVLEKLRVAFVPVDNTMTIDFPMSVTMRLYGEHFTAMQMVWPDKNDRFPWHWDYDDACKPHQPLLGTWKGD